MRATGSGNVHIQALSALSIGLLVASCGSGSGAGSSPDAAANDPIAFGGGGAALDSGATGGAGGSSSGAAGSSTDAAPAACTLALHYGHGAAVVANNWSSAELAVRVRCGQAPAPGRSITWSLIAGDGVLGESASASSGSAMSSDTDGDGIARAVYRHPGGFSQPTWSNVPGKVSATLDGASVELDVTAFNPGSSTPMLPQAYVVVPPGGGNGADLGSAKAGSVLPGALEVAVANGTGVSQGQGVPNIGVRLFGSDDDALHCVGDGYTALTDETGVATCDLQLPAIPGEHVFDLDVGRVLKWQGLRVHVTP